MLPSSTPTNSSAARRCIFGETVKLVHRVPESPIANLFCFLFHVNSWLVFLLLTSVAQSQNLDFHFSNFNGSFLTCTGIPEIGGYAFCKYNNSLGLLSSEFSAIYESQACRAMYKDPVTFFNVGATVFASFSTFFIFSVTHTLAYPAPAPIGSGLAFLIAPTYTTSASSDNSGLGLFPYDSTTGDSTAGADSQVIAIEFDTFLSTPIDTVSVPHVGLDINSLKSVQASALDTTYLETTVGMWIDYNSSTAVLEVFITPVAKTDGSAASLKPAVPVFTYSSWKPANYIQRKSYVGFSASANNGQWENNQIFFWSFQSSGFPPAPPRSWLSYWWSPLTRKGKMAAIAGAVVGTLLGFYCLSECLFFCFCKRIKKPVTEAEKKWPVRRRTTLPGTKERPSVVKPLPPSPRKVRDSFSVATPLNLWGAPLESEPTVAEIQDKEVPEILRDYEVPKIVESNEIQKILRDYEVPKLLGVPKMLGGNGAPEMLWDDEASNILADYAVPKLLGVPKIYGGNEVPEMLGGNELPKISEHHSSDEESTSRPLKSFAKQSILANPLFEDEGSSSGAQPVLNLANNLLFEADSRSPRKSSRHGKSTGVTGSSASRRSLPGIASPHIFDNSSQDEKNVSRANKRSPVVDTPPKEILQKTGETPSSHAGKEAQMKKRSPSAEQKGSPTQVERKLSSKSEKRHMREETLSTAKAAMVESKAEQKPLQRGSPVLRKPSHAKTTSPLTRNDTTPKDNSFSDDVSPPQVATPPSQGKDADEDTASSTASDI